MNWSVVFGVYMTLASIYGSGLVAAARITGHESTFDQYFVVVAAVWAAFCWGSFAKQRYIPPVEG